MPRNRLTDTQAFRWKDQELHGFLTNFGDTSKPRLAIHEFLKRDGAAIEYMGRAPRRFKMSLVFVGADWRKRYVNLLASIDNDPKGLLVHPLLGKVRVACEGVDGSNVDVSRELDTISVPLTFVEDAVDTQLEATAEDKQSVSAKQALVTTRTSELSTNAAKFTTAATKVALAVSSATTYAAAAQAAALASTPDPTLATKLGDVQEACKDVRAAVLADPVATSAALAFPAIASAEQVYDACLQLAAAADALRPPTITFTVPQTMHVASLAARLYGKDGSRRIDENLTLNRITNPAAIPGGTVLLVASAA